MQRAEWCLKCEPTLATVFRASRKTAAPALYEMCETRFFLMLWKSPENDSTCMTKVVF